MNGYNFTENVRKALATARDEAEALHHPYIGTEHIVLALLRDDLAVAALGNLSVDPEAVRGLLFEAIKPGRPGDMTGPDLPYTARAKKILEESMAEAMELNHDYVGTEHLLLGVLRERNGIGGQALARAGATLEKTREEVLRILGEQPSPPKLHASPWAAATAAELSSTPPILQYDQRVDAVLSAAYKVATRERSSELTTVHVAIALLEHGHGVANAALSMLDFDRDAGLSALRALTKPATDGPSPEGMLTLSAPMTSILESLRDQHRASNTTLGTHHLLLDILSRPSDVVEVFANQNITEQAVRGAVRRISG